VNSSPQYLLPLYCFGSFLIQIEAVKKMFERAPKTMLIGSWVATQYFVFMTWLVFRVEDTEMMWRSLKSFMGIDAHWNQTEFINALPEIKLLTVGLVGIFILMHGFSGRIGGLKYWISRQNSFIWGIICGILLTATFLLRPAETIDFIYFRF